MKEKRAMESGGLSFRKGDWAAIVFVAAISVLTLVLFCGKDIPDEGKTVRVYLNGSLIKEYSLDTDAEFEVKGEYRNRVMIKDGRAAIVDSDCPGEDCVHMGWISNGGRSIVCLPNRMEIRIEGGSDVDFTVG